MLTEEDASDGGFAVAPGGLLIDTAEGDDFEHHTNTLSRAAAAATAAPVAQMDTDEQLNGSDGDLRVRRRRPKRKAEDVCGWAALCLILFAVGGALVFAISRVDDNALGVATKAPTLAPTTPPTTTQQPPPPPPATPLPPTPQPPPTVPPLRVRLAGGAVASEGRVEVQLRAAGGEGEGVDAAASWGTVCGDGWGLPQADVVCRELGYAGGALAALRSAGEVGGFGEGRGPVALDDVACAGTEGALAACRHRPVGEHDCTHAQDAGVVCYDAAARAPTPPPLWGGGDGVRCTLAPLHFTQSAVTVVALARVAEGSTVRVFSGFGGRDNETFATTRAYEPGDTFSVPLPSSIAYGDAAEAGGGGEAPPPSPFRDTFPFPLPGDDDTSASPPLPGGIADGDAAINVTVSQPPPQADGGGEAEAAATKEGESSLLVYLGGNLATYRLPWAAERCWIAFDGRVVSAKYAAAAGENGAGVAGTRGALAGRLYDASLWATSTDPASVFPPYAGWTVRVLAGREAPTPPPPPPPSPPCGAAAATAGAFVLRKRVYLRHYALGDGAPYSSDEAAMLCRNLGWACGGFTCGAGGGACTLRGGSTPVLSPTEEYSCVKTAEAAAADRVGPGGDPAGCVAFRQGCGGARSARLDRSCDAVVWESGGGGGGGGACQCGGHRLLNLCGGVLPRLNVSRGTCREVCALPVFDECSDARTNPCGGQTCVDADTSPLSLGDTRCLCSTGARRPPLTSAAYTPFRHVVGEGEPADCAASPYVKVPLTTQASGGNSTEEEEAAEGGEEGGEEGGAPQPPASPRVLTCPPNLFRVDSAEKCEAAVAALLGGGGNASAAAGAAPALRRVSVRRPDDDGPDPDPACAVAADGATALWVAYAPAEPLEGSAAAARDAAAADVVAAASCGVCETGELPGGLRPPPDDFTASDAEQEAALRALVGRVFSSHGRTAGAPFAGGPAVEALGVRVRRDTSYPRCRLRVAAPPSSGVGSLRFDVEANSAVAGATCVNEYLQRHNMSVSRGGRSVARGLAGAEVVWQPADIRRRARVKYRYAYNACTFSYSMAWWGWREWEAELDWLALRGVDLPLAFVGQEWLWREVYLGMGLTEAELAEHFSGPSFFAWERMGNLEGWLGGPSVSFLRRRFELQQRIVARMRLLGMRPVLPAFAGHVPRALRRVRPGSSYVESGTWNQFRGVTLVRPGTELFANISTLFLEAQARAYNGTAHFYSADTYNEMEPESSDPAFLSAAAAAVQDGILAGDPHGKWVFQGWMFTRGWWKADAARVEAYVSGLRKADALILDLTSPTQPVYARTDGYYGTSYVWNLLHNYGGRPGIYGDLPLYRRSLLDAVGRVGPSGAAGVGVAMEALTRQNPVAYDLVLRLAWGDDGSAAGEDPADAAPLEAWEAAWVSARYGLGRAGGRGAGAEAAFASVVAAWRLLLNGVYRGDTDPSAGRFAIYDRPRLGALCSREELFDGVAEAWALLADAEPVLFPPGAPPQDADGAAAAVYAADLGSLAAEVLQEQACVRLRRVAAQVEALAGGLDADAAAAAKAEIAAGVRGVADVLRDVDGALRGVRETSLRCHLEAAAGWAEDAAEALLFQQGTLNQLTVWGPSSFKLNDYAKKAWAGLAEAYYAPRWEMLAATLEERVNETEALATVQAVADRRLQVFEEGWYVSAPQELLGGGNSTETGGGGPCEGVRVPPDVIRRKYFA